MERNHHLNLFYNGCDFYPHQVHYSLVKYILFHHLNLLYLLDKFNTFHLSTFFRTYRIYKCHIYTLLVFVDTQDMVYKYHLL